jgi:hypothetical protein
MVDLILLLSEGTRPRRAGRPRTAGRNGRAEVRILLRMVRIRKIENGSRSMADAA